MSFLNPLLLLGLPLIALPIIIHLINQRRYQTIRWAAMMFLLAANRMSRGYARIRQWLIMAFRMAAIATLIFAISRPLAGGWVGLAAGGRPDTTIVLLDRSPSMQQGGASGSKLETGRRQLAQTFETIGSARWALVESATNKVRELESAGELLTAPVPSPIGASSDIPGMLGVAADYLKANKAGRTEVWIGSDLRENDWNADGGRWQALAGCVPPVPAGRPVPPARLPAGGARQRGDPRDRGPPPEGGRRGGIARLAPAESRGDGIGPRVDPRAVRGRRGTLGGRGRDGGDAGRAEGPQDPPRSGPRAGLGQGVDPGRREPGRQRVLLRLRPPGRAAGRDRGRGRRGREAAATRRVDRARPRTAVLGGSRWRRTRWGRSSGRRSRCCSGRPRCRRGTRRSRSARSSSGAGGRSSSRRGRRGRGSCSGSKWTKWEEPKAEVAVESWRSDEDILAKTQSGAALPVGKLQMKKWCGLSGDVTPLATLKGGATLLARATTERGGAYFCGTTPAGADSSLATGRRRPLRPRPARAGRGGRGPEQHAATDRGRPVR